MEGSRPRFIVVDEHLRMVEDRWFSPLNSEESLAIRDQPAQLSWDDPAADPYGDLLRAIEQVKSYPYWPLVERWPN